MSNIRTPAELQAALEAIILELRATEWDKVGSETLVPLALSLKATCEHGALVHNQIELRVLTNGQMVPGVATKPEVKHRKWNDEETAEQIAQERYGDAAFTRKLKSPAQFEKMEGGDVFVALASYKPEAGKKVVY